MPESNFFSQATLLFAPFCVHMATHNTARCIEQIVLMKADMCDFFLFVVVAFIWSVARSFHGSSYCFVSFFFYFHSPCCCNVVDIILLSVINNPTHSQLVSLIFIYFHQQPELIGTRAGTDNKAEASGDAVVVVNDVATAAAASEVLMMCGAVLIRGGGPGGRTCY